MLKVAIEIYNGYLKGYARVPDEKELRETQLRPYLQDLVKSSVQGLLEKFSKKGGERGQTEEMAIKVAIEFCLNIGATQFLFSVMLSVFSHYKLRSLFIRNLEPFILSGQFRNEFVPEDILREFL